jgi:hypothetical protein
MYEDTYDVSWLLPFYIYPPNKEKPSITIIIFFFKIIFLLPSSFKLV